MSELKLEPNQAVTIEIPAGKDHPGARLQAFVIAVSERAIWLEPFRLLEPDSAPDFQPGQAVRLKYWDPHGLYYSDTEILDIRVSETKSLTVTLPKDILVVQRRRFFRTFLEVPFTFSVLDEESLPTGPASASTTIDIGGGGLRFETERPLSLGTRLGISLKFAKGQRVKVQARVARVDTLSGGKYDVGAEFIQITEPERDRIIQFLFAIQSRARKQVKLKYSRDELE